MSSPKNFQNHQNYSPYRTINSKASSYSPNGMQNNHNQSYTMATYKTRNVSQSDTEAISSIHQENSLLRQQNKALKRQINLIKGEYLTKTFGVGSQANSNQINDMRETIKKQAGQIKQLKTRLEVVSKQCRMYQQIIDKMEGKIHKLTQLNKSLQYKLKQRSKTERIEWDPKMEVKNQDIFKSKQNFNRLTQKINEITGMYLELEEEVHESDKQWEIWKQKWGKQKHYYLNRIRDLQQMAGIGVQSKQFYRKKF